MPFVAYYESLKKDFKKDQAAPAVTDLLLAAYVESESYVKGLDKKPLESRVPGKEYFTFGKEGKLSRAVNKDLFDPELVRPFVKRFSHGGLDELSVEAITSAVYTLAISFCCAVDIKTVVDMKKKGDQKTPATFFEYLICHIYTKLLGVAPRKQLDVVSLGKQTTLPTDFVFDLGENRPKFHLPVKTSTRERAVQAWAHQAMLNAVYGTDTLTGTLVCIAETKLDHKKLQVIEICLPAQWKIYQMYVAKLKRVYYLDVPRRYEDLKNGNPRIDVMPFGTFFKEVDELCAG